MKCKDCQEFNGKRNAPPCKYRKGTDQENICISFVRRVVPSQAQVRMEARA